MMGDDGERLGRACRLRAPAGGLLCCCIGGLAALAGCRDGCGTRRAGGQAGSVPTMQQVHAPCVTAAAAVHTPHKLLQEGAEELCRQVVDDAALGGRLTALRRAELARGLDPELLRRYVLYVRRYRYPVSCCAGSLAGRACAALGRLRPARAACCGRTRAGRMLAACAGWRRVLTARACAVCCAAARAAAGHQPGDAYEP